MKTSTVKSKSRVLSILLIVGLIMWLIPAAPVSAAAAQYRLKEERAHGMRTEYYYDQNGRLYRSITYDENGNAYSASDYTCGTNGEPVEKKWYFVETSGIGEFYLIFHYDINGTQIELSNAGLGGDLYWYADISDMTSKKDASGRITEVTIKGNPKGWEADQTRVYSYTYDRWGRIQTFTLTTSGLNYDGKWEQSTSIRDEFVYSSDGSFYRTRETDWDPGTKIMETYDTSQRLIAGTDGSGATFTYSYQYDQNGNISSRTTSGGSYPFETKYYYEKIY